MKLMKRIKKSLFYTNASFIAPFFFAPWFCWIDDKKNCRVWNCIYCMGSKGDRCKKIEIESLSKEKN